MDRDGYWKYYDGISHKIDEENKLLNSRIHSLLIMQTILFAAYFVKDGEVNGKISILIPLLGIAFSIIMWNSFWISEKAIGFILVWWKNWLEQVNLPDDCFPPVWAGDPHRYHRNTKSITDNFMTRYGKYLSYRHSVPFCFILTWCVLMFLSHYDFINNIIIKLIEEIWAV